MQRTLFMLIGPKGAGKTHIGMLVNQYTAIRFLRVESIWLGLQPGEDGWKKVEQAVDALFQTHQKVMVESLGVGDGFRDMHASLAKKYAIKMIRVRAELDTCLARVKSRESTAHIAVSDEKVEEYNQLAARVSYAWDLEIDNNKPVADADILKAIRSLEEHMDNELKIPENLSIDKFVDIGTHKLHVTLSDLPGEYTIILEAGGGKASDSYRQIQDALANRTRLRVLSYDRSGFGQSELGPAHFNAVDEIQALKKCLEVLGVHGKLILVGLSYGGFLIQLFTALYPELVSGLVLIDPMNVKFVDRFGLDNLNAVTPYFSNPAMNYEKAGNRMVDSSTESFAALRGKELARQVPVILITSGNPPFMKEIWRQCHEEMVMNSENHQLLIAEGNNHDIVEENPGLVLNAIIELVNRVRAG